MDLGLRGKSVLITGASKGIGRAAAFAFAAEGCRLYAVARDGAALDSLAREIVGLHTEPVTPIVADLRQAGQIQAVAERASDADILINNAGDIPPGTLEAIDEEAWRRAWDLKVFGYIDLCREMMRTMKCRGQGVIINNLGVAGERLSYDYIAGSTGNAALIAFTRSVGSKSLDDGIRVVGISPGLVLTERIVTIYKNLAGARFGDESRYGEILAEQRQSTLVEPQEVADVMTFLASERARRISGAVVPVDGGLAAYHSLGGS